MQISSKAETNLFIFKGYRDSQNKARVQWRENVITQSSSFALKLVRTCLTWECCCSQKKRKWNQGMGREGKFERRGSSFSRIKEEIRRNEPKR